MNTMLIKCKVKRKVPGFMGGFSWEIGYVYFGRYDLAEFTILATNKTLDLLPIEGRGVIERRGFKIESHSSYQSEMCIQNVFTYIASYHKVNGVS